MVAFDAIINAQMVAVTISICMLIILLLFIMMCVCWEGKKTRSLHQFYVLDENGMKKLSETTNSANEVDSNTTGFFRRFSSNNVLKPYFTFANRFDTNKVLSTYEKEHIIIENEKDLLDSLDIDKQFNQTRLQIDICDTQYLQGPKHPDDDCESCISAESHHSFYSVYPYARTTSIADTMKSANSQPDMMDI